jgi:hypothetical protein
MRGALVHDGRLLAIVVEDPTVLVDLDHIAQGVHVPLPGHVARTPVAYRVHRTSAVPACTESNPQCSYVLTMRLVWLLERLLTQRPADPTAKQTATMAERSKRAERRSAAQWLQQAQRVGPEPGCPQRVTTVTVTGIRKSRSAAAIGRPQRG